MFRFKWGELANALKCISKYSAPQKLQPGGHPTIPYGTIRAEPTAEGGYELTVYKGIGLGWLFAGHVRTDDGLQEAEKNLTRPVITFTPTTESESSE